MRVHHRRLDPDGPTEAPSAAAQAPLLDGQNGGTGLRELNNSMTGALLAYVRRIGGDTKVVALLERAGETTPLADLEDQNNWSSYEETLRRFVAAAEVMDDPDVGRHAGAEVFSHYSSSAVIEILRSLGGPAEAMGLIAETATKQSTVTTMTCVETAETSVLVSAVTAAPITRHRLFCDYTAGALGSLPTVFGLDVGTVAEIECQRRGDARCLYRVAWDPSTSDDPEVRAKFLTAQVAALTGRFESLERLASELAAIGDIDEALRTITVRTGVAVRAPQYLLAVRLPREHKPRVHSVGFEPEELDRSSAEILAANPDDHQGSRLIVDVASSTIHFGRLAAFYPEGRRFLPEERRLLEAYAGHAAAVLSTAAALAEARERAETIGALFDLTTALAEVGTVDEIAERLARAVPAVVQCENAAVFVWEPRDARLVCRGRSDSSMDGHNLGIALDRSLIVLLTRNPEAVVYGPAAAESAWSEIGSVVGYRSGVLVPVVTRHTLLGVVVTESGLWTLGSEPTEVHRTRLNGIGAIAATAIDNALLLEQVRHQAGHDALTGLPNSRLLEELTTAALATAKRHGYGVGAMYVDLDLFKEVNDELGHHAGDRLLVEVGSRLRAAVRAGDAVARLGGDEFGVLLPHVAEVSAAKVVAERILDVLTEPFIVQSKRVEVSASIGIAISSAGADTFESLIRRADVAMYEAKALGRAGYSVHT